MHANVYKFICRERVGVRTTQIHVLQYINMNMLCMCIHTYVHEYVYTDRYTYTDIHKDTYKQLEGESDITYIYVINIIEFKIFCTNLIWFMYMHYQK